MLELVENWYNRMSQVHGITDRYQVTKFPLEIHASLWGGEVKNHYKLVEHDLHKKLNEGGRICLFNALALVC